MDGSTKKEKIKSEIKNIRESKSKNLLQLLMLLKDESLLIPASINVSVKTNVDEDELMPGDNLAVKNSTKLNLAMLKNEAGMKVIPVFTDEEELVKGGNAPSLRMNFESVCTKLLALNKQASGVAINPFGESLFLPRELLEKFWTDRPWEKLMALKKTKLEKGTRLKIGTPDSYPPRLIEVLTEFFRTQPSVEKAYISMMETKGSLSWLLIPIIPEEDTERIYSGITAAAKGFTGEIPISFLPQSSAVVKSLIEKIEPFYVRDEGTDED